MKAMPVAKQEQVIAELVAQQKRRESLSEEERAKEDAETADTVQRFNAMLQGLDPQQKQIIMQSMNQMVPSAAQAYMKKLIAGGAD